MNVRNEIKACIVREGLTMSEVVERMAVNYGWSRSVPNFSDKLKRNSLRYREVMETFADKKDAAPLQQEKMQNINKKRN